VKQFTKRITVLINQSTTWVDESRACICNDRFRI